MPLSDEERQRLAQLEASLAEDDPFLASTLRGTKLAPPPTITTLEPQPVRPKLDARSALVASVGAAAGLALLIAGISLHWSISIVGFVLMLLAALVGTGVLHLHGKTGTRKTSETKTSGSAVKTSSKAPKESQAQFMDKLEERWRRRQDRP